MNEDYHHIIKELGFDNQVFNGKTVLLTGSQGFLGRLYQQYFNYLNTNVLSEPTRVICVDNLIAGSSFEGTCYANFNYLTWDISTPYPPETLSETRIDYVINAAGIASPKVYVKKPFQTMAVSQQGTANIIELCRSNNVKRSLFFSSSEIYGDPDVIPTPESYVGRIDLRTKRSAYDVGKMSITTMCYNANEEWNLNVQVVNPFNVLGYCQNDGRVVPNSFSKLLRGEKLTVFNPGTQTRTFCWFSDFIVGSIKVLLRGDGAPYNIGNDNNEISMFDLAVKIQSIAGMKEMIQMVDPTEVYKTEPMRRCPDITRAKMLGYEPKIALDDALRKFFLWTRKNYK